VHLARSLASFLLLLDVTAVTYLPARQATMTHWDYLTSCPTTVVRCISKELRPNIRDPNSRRIRYISYIINLIIKTFLFRINAESLEVKDLLKT
jgi:hypothetical protein